MARIIGHSRSIGQDFAKMQLEVLRGTLSIGEKMRTLESLIFTFQYYPVSLSEYITVEYDETIVPGGSHPIYQWVSTGEHTITMTVYLARDTVQVLVGRAGRKLEVKDMSVEEKLFNIDVADAINALKFLAYPTYSNLTTIAFNLNGIAPPVCRLILPNSKLGGDKKDGIFVILKNLNIEYLAFFPDGTPRIATADLDFLEIINTPIGFRFKDRNTELLNLFKKYIVHGPKSANPGSKI